MLCPNCKENDCDACLDTWERNGDECYCDCSCQEFQAVDNDYVSYDINRLTGEEFYRDDDW